MIYEELNLEQGECWRCCVERIASEISKDAAMEAVKEYKRLAVPMMANHPPGDELAAFKVLSDLDLIEVWDDERED